MRPAGILGVLLIIAGAVIVVMGGIGFTKDRDEVEVGPIEIAAEEKGFISPVVGGIAVVVGIGLLLVGRRASART